MVHTHVRPGATPGPATFFGVTMPSGMSGSEAKRLQRLRDSAFRRQRGFCWWCNKPMSQGIENIPDACSGDHLIRRVDGGRTEEGNIVAACRKCNSSRHRYEVITWSEPGSATLADIWPTLCPTS